MLNVFPSSQIKKEAPTTCCTSHEHHSGKQPMAVFLGNRIDGGCHSNMMGIITVYFQFKVVYHLSHTPLCVRAKAWAQAALSQSDGRKERHLFRVKAQGSAVSLEWRWKRREWLLIRMKVGKSTLCFSVKECRQDNLWKTLLPLSLPGWGEWQKQEGGAIQE